MLIISSLFLKWGTNQRSITRTMIFQFVRPGTTSAILAKLGAILQDREYMMKELEVDTKALFDSKKILGKMVFLFGRKTK